MDRFARVVAERPGWVLAMVVAITVVALAGIVDFRSGRIRIEIDPSVERLLPEGDEARVFYDRIQKTFGSDATLLVGIQDDDLFTPVKLARIEKLTRRLEEIEAVESVLSLATASKIRGVDGDLDVSPFLDPLPEDEAAAARLRDEVLATPVYAGTLVSPDGRATGLLVQFRAIPDSELIRSGVDQEILRIAEEEAPGSRVWIGGNPLVKAQLSRGIQGDLEWIVPAVLVESSILLAFAFRSASAVALPLLGILITAIWTIGTIGWAGRPINLVTASVPALLVAIGFSYATYVVSEYHETLREAEREGDRNLTSVTRRAVAAILLPALVASITTIQGFGSLAFTNITAVREFGLFSAAGVFYAFLVGVTFTPAAFRLLGARRPPRERGEGFLERAAERIARFDLRHRRAIFLGAAVVFAIALAGALRLEVGSDYITQFSADSRIRQDFQAINQHLGGVSSLYVVVASTAPDAFAEPENLRELRSLQDWLRAQPEVGSAVSVVDYLMLLNRGMHDNDPAFLAIPDSERLVKQLLLFGSTDEVDRFVAADYATANIVARATVLDSRPSLELTRRIEERLASLPSHLQGRVTGGIVLLGESTENIARGQVRSLGTALAAIYLMISLMLTSLRVGLVALIPNVLPVVIFFAALGYTNTQLSVSVSLVGSMALGIAVDDSVHYFARFNSESRRLGSEEKATISTLRASIRPATTTMLGLCVGFLLVGQSSLRAQQEFGMLAAFTMAVGWVAELLLTPALGASTRIVTLWDLLTLDLGKDPHRAIPLFSGLSVRQARMVALLADLVELPAGTFLLREGEPGGDMYVVVEGTLRSSVRRDGKRVEFSTSSRGDVLGEFALFGGIRTADVETLTDTRLIRIETEDLERIRRRSPRTASIVLRNLNRIQAERMATTVARVG